MVGLSPLQISNVTSDGGTGIAQLTGTVRSDGGTGSSVDRNC